MNHSFSLFLFIVSLVLWTKSVDAQWLDFKSPNFQEKDVATEQFYELYYHLSEEKPVILEFFTTWCNPCWNYHQTGALSEFYKVYGPDSLNQAMVFQIECDKDTHLEDLLGETENSTGNWLEHSPFPIIDANELRYKFGNVFSYPTSYLVCPDRSIKNIAELNFEGLVNVIKECDSLVLPDLHASFLTSNPIQCEGPSIIKFEDTSYPLPNSWEWDFGDGHISTDRDPSHIYEEAGEYTVKLSIERNNETNEVTKEDLIRIENESEGISHFVGPWDATIGNALHIESGVRGLLFDVMEPLILESVLVYSEKEEDRTFVLQNDEGEILYKQNHLIPEGQFRVELEFYIEPGLNYRLGLQSDAHFERNSSGASYPYLIEDLISINSSDGSLVSYYFFYDWKIREAECASISNAKHAVEPKLVLYPNPAMDFIQFESKYHSAEYVLIYDLLGNPHKVPIVTYSGFSKINISTLKDGMYWTVINGQPYSFVKCN